MNRTNIIQSLARYRNAQSYLEIGVAAGDNFNAIITPVKIGIDPDRTSAATHYMTSDSFFESNQQKFDIIFIDGYHGHSQVMSDILNSLKILNEGGYIVCHDMNPISESHQTPEWNGGAWNGDGWRALVKFRSTHPHRVMTVDIDEGVTIIDTAHNYDYNRLVIDPLDHLDYANLVKNRKSWLNLISPTEFVKQYLNIDLARDDLYQYINEPNNPLFNRELAYGYDAMGQLATAVSFYIRTAERSQDSELVYECLLRAAKCFEAQGTRGFSVKGLLQRAVSLFPDRPEAYYQLSLYYEKEAHDDGKWFDCFTMSSIGLSTPLHTSPYPDLYPGDEYFQLQHGLAAWWCGIYDVAQQIFSSLIDTTSNDIIKQRSIKNLEFMGIKQELFYTFKADDHKSLKYKFNGSDNVNRNYSEAFQDMFVLAVTDGMTNGHYVEIGSGDPYYGNNTALLEQSFQWRGLSFDIDENAIAAHKNHRQHKAYLKDATTVNFAAYFKANDFPDIIDYLQIDCDPPHVSFEVLLNIPFEQYKFRIITFEHDAYMGDDEIRTKSRTFLKSHGYKLLVGNISPDDNRPYEDWYVYPSQFYSRFQNTEETVLMAKNYMLKDNK